jgi:hypothetical protein
LGFKVKLLFFKGSFKAVGFTGGVYWAAMASNLALNRVSPDTLEKLAGSVIGRRFTFSPKIMSFRVASLKSPIFGPRDAARICLVKPSGDPSGSNFRRNSGDNLTIFESSPKRPLASKGLEKVKNKARAARQAAPSRQQADL